MFNQTVSNAKAGGQIIGKIDEVFGRQSQSYFSVTPSVGVKLDGFAKGDKVFLDKAFILPLSYILSCETPKPKIQKPRGEQGQAGAQGRPGGFNRGFAPQGKGNFNRGNFNGQNRGNFNNQNRGNFNSQNRTNQRQ